MAPVRVSHRELRRTFAGAESIRDTTTVELRNGETLRMTTLGELIREGVVVASVDLASVAGLRCRADAIVERAARCSPHAVCVNCD